MSSLVIEEVQGDPGEGGLNRGAATAELETSILETRARGRVGSGANRTDADACISSAEGSNAIIITTRRWLKRPDIYCLR